MRSALPDIEAARVWLERHSAEFVAWRHELHAHPETAFRELRTGNFVADKLATWGLDVHRGIARTGLVATLGGGTAAAIGLRADLDALPIEEANPFDHHSTHPGCMHACGHDGHTVMLLAAARYLGEHHGSGQRLPGPVHFIFQPAEENEAGGRAMIEDGLFDRFPVDSVYGMHNLPGLAVGHFMVRNGPTAAGFDTFDILVNAGGGHSAFPAANGDAVSAAAALVMHLQTIVSRQISATDNAVLSVTQLHGGTAYNVLPHEVRISGSVRWFAPGVRAEIRRRMDMHARGVAQAYGLDVDIRYTEGYPAVVNAEGAAALAACAARDVAGADRVATDFPPLMGSEDFAFMLQKSPGAYLATGNGPIDGGRVLHSPNYDFNDAAIGHGALFWIALCRRFFEGNAARGIPPAAVRLEPACPS